MLKNIKSPKIPPVLKSLEAKIQNGRHLWGDLALCIHLIKLYECDTCFIPFSGMINLVLYMKSCSRVIWGHCWQFQCHFKVILRSYIQKNPNTLVWHTFYNFFGVKQIFFVSKWRPKVTLHKYVPFKVIWRTFITVFRYNITITMYLKNYTYHIILQVLISFKTISDTFMYYTF